MNIPAAPLIELLTNNLLAERQTIELLRRVRETVPIAAEQASSGHSGNSRCTLLSDAVQWTHSVLN